MKALILTLLFLAPTAEASCPKNKMEWQAVAPKLLVITAAKKTTKADIDDFSAKIGKSAKGKATPFHDRDRNAEYVLVEAQNPETSVALSGIMKCDLAIKEPVLLSLTWIKGDKSGLVKMAP